MNPSSLGRAGAATSGRRRPWSPVRRGLIALVVILLAGACLFNKNAIKDALRPGDTFEVHFASGVMLKPHLSQVKVAFVPVGTVTGVRRDSDGGSVVTVKVDDGVRNRLGSAPSAVVRPTTLLGGNYFVDLVPGGDRGSFSGSIPASRTSLPVELDKIASVFQPGAIAGTRSSLKNLDLALRRGGSRALRRLAIDAPKAMEPSAKVLRALQGTDPNHDLTRLVQNLDQTGRVLTARHGQLADVVDNLEVVTSTLSGRADALATTIRRLPDTLRNARAGMSRLDVTLSTLRTVAPQLEPSVDQLNSTLVRAVPVLTRARPVVKQLRHVLTDTDPLLRDLTPTATGYTTVLRAVRGRVLGRVNGPIRATITGPFRGAGPYAQTSSDLPLYEDLAHMFATMDRAAAMTDKNGAAIGFQPGIGTDSLGDLVPAPVQTIFSLLGGMPVVTGGNK